MTPLLSDARPARQAGEGSQRAFAAIYERYHQDIYRFCLTIVGRPEDAQDALQNTMVKALRALPGERREIKLKPWLYRVAHNESIDLLRRRREGQELDSVQLAAVAEVSERAAVRERLSHLLTDIGELPERQRSALVMRELSGLGYEQIAEAFETSASVARQTVYEARLGLRELEAGREMTCNEVTRQLSEADGRVARRRDIRAHLRACSDCRAFRDAIDTRRHDLAALSPLPVAAAASILHGLAVGKAAGSGLGGAATAAGAGAGVGKVAGTSAVVKAVATVAVTATVGVTAADRSGLVDARLPGGSTSESAREAGAGATGGEGGSAISHETDQPVSEEDGAGDGSGRPEGGNVQEASDPNGPGSQPNGQNSNRADGAAPGGPPDSLPEAASHGQETAASHKANGTDNPGQSRRHESSSTGKSNRGSKSRGNSGAPSKGRSQQASGKGASKAKSPPPPPPPKPAKPATPPAAPETASGEAAPEAGEAPSSETEASP